MAKRKSPKQRKEERQQEKRRGQQTLIIGAVVLVAIFAATIFALTSVPAEAPIPDDLDQFDRFLQSTTDEGYPLLGNPDALQVREYSSFSCPGCLDFHNNVFPGLVDDIEAGRISFVYVPLQTGSVPNPEGAARTALCAGEQDQFWQMHEVLFSWHEIYVNSAFQDGRIRTGVKAIGLDTGEFNSCFNSNATTAILSSARGEGITSTPSILIDGAPVGANLAEIEAAIDARIGGRTDFASGLVDDETSDDSTEDDAEVVEEAESEATESAEETDTDAEATESVEETDTDVEAEETEMAEDSDNSEDAPEEATEESDE